MAAASRASAASSGLSAQSAWMSVSRVWTTAPLVIAQLARDEIGGLDAVGAFVDRGDARVAIELRGAGFLDEAHAAMDLYAQAGDFAADVGAPGFEQGHQRFGAFLRRGIAQRAAIDLAGGVIQQRACAFGHRPHAQQHAADVGVFGDRDRSLVGAAGARALDAVARIGARLLQRGFGDLHALAADVDSRRIHHREHRGQPAVFAADQFADACIVIAKGHHACGRGVDAQFVFDRGAAHVVCARRACHRRRRGIWAR